MIIELTENTEIIVITGPESSGKTTLAERISELQQLHLVSEYARAYLDYYGQKYTFQDIRKIAFKQVENEQLAHKKNSLIVCDTDIVTLEIWAMEKYGRSLNYKDHLKDKKHYFLCYPDIPWEPDPLRENPNDRERLFTIYETYLKSSGVKYSILKEKDRVNLSLHLK